MYATQNFSAKGNANAVTNVITSVKIISLSIIRVLKQRELRMFAMAALKKSVADLISITIVQLEHSKNIKQS
jgi:hypothetical protein